MLTNRFQNQPLCVEVVGYKIVAYYTKLSSPVTGLEWPRWFQEVKVPRFNDNDIRSW